MAKKRLRQDEIPTEQVSVEVQLNFNFIQLITVRETDKKRTKLNH